MKLCRGKQCYDKRGAESARNRRLRGRNAPDYLRIYHCPRCNCWHLTSKETQ
jgi:hypothetical protein